MTDTRRYWADLAERAVRSFIGGVFAVWLVNPSQPVEFDTLFTLTNLKAGVAAAVVSIAMAILGRNFGNPNSASVLPPAAQPVAPQPAVTHRAVPVLGMDAEAQLADLLARIQPIAPPPPPAPAPADAVVYIPVPRTAALLPSGQPVGGRSGPGTDGNS